MMGQQTFLNTFEREMPFGELAVETLLDTEGPNLTVPTTKQLINQAMERAPKRPTDITAVPPSQANDIRWIEVARNVAQAKRSDISWIEVTQSVTQRKYTDDQWIEVTQGITQDQWGNDQWIEVKKSTPAKVRIIQISYLVALTTLGFTLGLSLLS